jgi:DNA-binding SARP family transcriptional activator
MHIQLLGSLTISQGDRRCVLTSSRAATVLALLALSPRVPVPIERLVDDVWSEHGITNARNALHANIRRLRKMFDGFSGQSGDKVVRTVRGGYLLDVPADAIDAHHFLALAQQGSVALERQPEEAMQLLEMALGLWRGPALLNLREGLRLRLEAASLDERRLSVCEDVATAKLAVGRGRFMTSELRKLAAEHPERERLVELLMLALYDDGRQAEALDVFHSARQQLIGDLGLEPGRALNRLYQAIVSQDESLGEPRSLRLRTAGMASPGIRTGSWLSRAYTG